MPTLSGPPADPNSPVARIRRRWRDGDSPRPFDPEAANLMFMLVSCRYERAAMIVTSNKPFSAWGEIFGRRGGGGGDDRPARPPRRDRGAQGHSYRLKDRDLARGPVEN